MTQVSIYGAGQLGTAAAEMLRKHGAYEVHGPFGRAERETALSSGAEVVIIATTTRFRDVANDIELAVASGSNVLVSAEECAYPFVVDKPLAARLDALAVAKGVSVAGCGINPGLIFDALVLTLLGGAPRDCTIEVSRTVDISGFGPTVLRRIGVGRTREAFAAAVKKEEILGHAGFPQSMHVVASAIGVVIERIEKELSPLISETPVRVRDLMVAAGESVGVTQSYTAFVNGAPWYVCRWFGHVDIASIPKATGDDITFYRGGRIFQTMQIRPAIGAQVGSQNMLVNSVARILKASAGWRTVSELAPAFPAPAAE
jgi:hypothetical protein